MKRKTIKKEEGGVGTAGISKLRRRNIEIAETVTTTTPEALTEPKKRGGGMLDFLRKKKGNDVTSAQDVQATEQATAQAALIEPAQEVQATQAALIEPAQTTEPATAPAEPAAPAPPAPTATAQISKEKQAKEKILALRDDLKSGNMLDSCLNLKTIEGCKSISSYDITNPTTEQTNRIKIINELSNSCLLTIANQNNKLISAEYNENKKERLEKLFKNLLHGFIKKFFKDINEQVTNIENPPDIDDENYKNGIKFVENYINSFYSNGIAIVGNDVKYYKLTDGKYTNYKYDIKYGKLTKFLFVIINNKNILIHQIFQQIIYGLIDTITKDDVIFNKYYSL
jgi:hypothetical protein